MRARSGSRAASARWSPPPRRATPSCARRPKFDFGVAQLPYYDDIRGAPGSHADRRRRAVGAGRQKGPPNIARWRNSLAWLARSEVQAEWHQSTGYVPVTRAAYELTAQSGFYKQNPGHEIAIKQLLLNQPNKENRGIRLGEFPEIRAILEQELEAVLGGQGAPEAGAGSGGRPRQPAAAQVRGREPPAALIRVVTFLKRGGRRVVRLPTTNPQEKPMRIKQLTLAMAAASLLSTGAQAQTEIQWWHSHDRGPWGTS